MLSQTSKQGKVTEMNIRLLQAEDVSAFRRLRLEGAKEFSGAFDPTYEEEEQQSLEMTIQRILPKGNPPEQFVLGAFLSEDELVGIAGFTRESMAKKRHKAWIWGVYVSPVVRGQKIGKALLLELLERAKDLKGLEQIQLNVTTASSAAHALYHSLGFQEYGKERRALKDNGIYLDEHLMVLSLETIR